MNSAYLLLDTNIVSYLMKSRPEVEPYLSYLSGRILTSLPWESSGPEQNMHDGESKSEKGWRALSVTL